MRVVVHLLPDNIDPARSAYVERTLLVEMQLQCEMGGVAWERLKTDLKHPTTREATIWTDVHSLLSAAACLSNFMEGANGESLRERTDTPEESLLLQRRVRDGVVHFEQRLMDALKDPRTTQLVLRHVARSSELFDHPDTTANLPPYMLVVLQFHPIRVTVVAQKVTRKPLSLNLEELSKEVKRLKGAITSLLNEPLQAATKAQKVQVRIRAETRSRE